MKLLSKPTNTHEVIEIGGRKSVDTETRFNVLGLIGIGPLLWTMERKPCGRTVRVQGRVVANPVLIDFEADGARRLCDASLVFEGLQYELRGLMPAENVRDNVWLTHVIDWKVVPDGSEKNSLSLAWSDFTHI